MNRDKIRRKLIERRILSEQTNPALVNQIKVILADNFLFYFKLHSFHWNVEGSTFVQDHEFLGKQYAAVFAIIDPLAEEIRMLNEYAPISLAELIRTSSISEMSSRVTDSKSMFAELSSDIAKLNSGLVSGRKMAEDSGETNLANFFDELLDANKKLDWMLKSLQK